MGEYIVKAASHYVRYMTPEYLHVTGATTIWEIPIVLSGWPNWSFWVKNLGGGTNAPFTDAHVEVTPDPSDPTYWVSLATEEDALEQLTDTLAINKTGPIMRLSNVCYHRARASFHVAPGQSTTALLWFETNQK